MTKVKVKSEVVMVLYHPGSKSALLVDWYNNTWVPFWSRFQWSCYIIPSAYYKIVRLGMEIIIFRNYIKNHAHPKCKVVSWDPGTEQGK